MEYIVKSVSQYLLRLDYDYLSGREMTIFNKGSLFQEALMWSGLAIAFVALIWLML